MGPTDDHPEAPAASVHAHADQLGAEPRAAERQRPAATDQPVVLSTRDLVKTYGNAGLFGRGRAGQGGARRGLRDPPRRDAGHRRRIGLGQVHRGALHRAADRPQRGPHRARRHRHRHHAGGPAARAAAQDPDHLPGPVSLAEPAPHGRPVDRRRPGQLRHAARRSLAARAPADGAGAAGPGIAATAIRTSSPAASASASASRARWRWSRSC